MWIVGDVHLAHTWRSSLCVGLIGLVRRRLLGLVHRCADLHTLGRGSSANRRTSHSTAALLWQRMRLSVRIIHDRSATDGRGLVRR